MTLKGEGLDETKLRDIAQFSVRNQLARVAGASVPVPFGGSYRQIMVYVDPFKLEAYQLSAMDIVRKVNNANLILPGGDVQIGDLDYNVFTNSQLDRISEINQMPVKVDKQSPGPRLGYRSRQGRAADPDERGPHRWPAVGVSARYETRRRYEYHRCRGWG